MNLKDDEKLLLIEGSLISSLLLEGLDCLRKANIYNKGLYYQAFFSLSIGIERLLKVLIIYDYKVKNNGNYPENNYIKEKGHNLNEMFNVVKPSLLQNDIYNLVISFLSEFSLTTRYYNLDILTGKNNNKLNPLEKWSSIEKSILKEYKVKIKKDGNKKEIVDFLNSVSYISYLDMELNEINNFNEIFDEAKIRDTIQGYDVLVFYNLIKSLVKTLKEYEEKYNFFPYLREFFEIFLGKYTDGEIRRKKCWKN